MSDRDSTNNCVCSCLWRCHHRTLILFLLINSGRFISIVQCFNLIKIVDGIAGQQIQQFCQATLQLIKYNFLSLPVNIQHIILWMGVNSPFGELYLVHCCHKFNKYGSISLCFSNEWKFGFNKCFIVKKLCGIPKTLFLHAA